MEGIFLFFLSSFLHIFHFRVGITSSVLKYFSRSRQVLQTSRSLMELFIDRDHRITRNMVLLYIVLNTAVIFYAAHTFCIHFPALDYAAMIFYDRSGFSFLQKCSSIGWKSIVNALIFGFDFLLLVIITS